MRLPSIREAKAELEWLSPQDTERTLWKFRAVHAFTIADRKAGGRDRCETIARVAAQFTARHRRFPISARQLRGWVALFKKRGLAGLATVPGCGSRSRLSESALAELPVPALIAHLRRVVDVLERRTCANDRK